jgi:hypothetical protein
MGCEYPGVDSMRVRPSTKAFVGALQRRVERRVDPVPAFLYGDASPLGLDAHDLDEPGRWRGIARVWRNLDRLRLGGSCPLPGDVVLLHHHRQHEIPPLLRAVRAIDGVEERRTIDDRRQGGGFSKR